MNQAASTAPALPLDALGEIVTVSVLGRNVRVRLEGREVINSYQSSKDGIAFNLQILNESEVDVRIEYHEFTDQEDIADRAYDVKISTGPDCTGTMSNAIAIVAAATHLVNLGLVPAGAQ